MSQRDVRAFLWDIDHACDVLTGAVRGKSIEDYANDEMMRLAIERAFEILAEALNNALRMQPGVADRITQAPRIISFRNRITHEYWATTHATVWTILHDYVPPLQREVRAILAEVPPPDLPSTPEPA
ncbi:MAG TPA: DUF86 domain-containing protein [Thermoanaerobaculia bacterium]|nr:DUF86 domain-containing protein [Thermoanaerobaculia bacterium]